MSSAIRVRGLSKSFGEIKAVRDLSLEVRKGEIYGFLGRNGAGKTTTIRMLLGLISPSSGEVELFGRSVRREREGALAKMGFLVEAATAYPNLTVRENLEIQRTLVGASVAAVDEVVERLALGPYARRRSSRLSLGNKQRLALARALVGSPELLVLDEPANGLDPAGIVEIRELMRSLASSGTTIFMSSHILAEVDQLADRIGIIHDGTLIEEHERGEAGSRKRMRVEVEADAPERAEAVLRESLGLREIKRAPEGALEHVLRISDSAASVPEIARALVGAGVGIERLVPIEENLEERFMRLTGGQK